VNSLEQTITEHDIDADTQQVLDGLKSPGGNEPDLAIDGLSESLLSRILRLFSPRGR